MLDNQISKSLEKPRKLKEYDEKGDPDKHVQLNEERLNYFYTDEAEKRKLFALTLTGSTIL